MKNLNILPLEPRDIPRSKAKCLDFSQCPTYNRCKVINLIHNRHFDLLTLQNNTKFSSKVCKNKQFLHLPFPKIDQAKTKRPITKVRIRICANMVARNPNTAASARAVRWTHNTAHAEVNCVRHWNNYAFCGQL